MQDENLGKMELLQASEKVEAELKDIALKVNYHEKHLDFLNAQMRATSESILDLQVKLGNYNKSLVCEEASNHEAEMITVKHTIEQILRQGNTAAGIICKLKFYHVFQASSLPWIKNVVGVVATLGSVKDDNLSSLLSKYLGLETMLAVVCKTHEDIKALEKYDRDAGLHDLGASIGRHIDRRFLAISLENLRAYQGKFLADDTQKRLDLLKPRLPDGKCPQGFLGYAVNMIDLDHNHLSFLTSNGHGLRETLFFTLFLRLQVYKSRAEMERAMPFITDGAVSLDSGIIRSNGQFYLGCRLL